MFTIDSTEDRALSPVIGVILLVGITVILVAVVGGLVTDFGSDVDVAPNAQLSTNATNGSSNFAITHESGDDLNPETIQVEIDDSSEDMDNLDDAPSGLLQAGNEITVAKSDIGSASGDLDSGEEIKVVWVGENGDSREVLLEQIVP